MSFVLPAIVLACGLVLVTHEARDPTPTFMSAARRAAMERISRAPKGSAVVFDFDDTLFDPHSVADTAHVGSRAYWNADRRAVPLYRPIVEMCDVLKFAVARGMYIVIITARPDNRATKQTVLHNFKKQRMQIQELPCSPHYPRHMNFKARLRQKLQLSRPIILTIGDQWGDVNEPDGYDWIKLPTKQEPLLVSSLPTAS
jgi:predicted secreted acid phosphatase